MTILPVYKDLYELLTSHGFQPCDRQGPEISFFIFPRPSLVALTKDNMTVYFYDLPTICVEQNGKQQVVSLFIRSERGSFIDFVKKNFK